MILSSGMDAPDFSLPDETGTIRSLSEIRGPDTTKSHTKFKAKYELPFTLLADAEHKVCELYGVWGTKKNYGREYQGVFRTTFLIDENGKIVHVFKNVKPAGHAGEVLAKLQAEA
jgi:peroxiredoxin Q/BCP